jgi:D-3-phosphoglycerate dehydrogenase / 2-oxoglutarate reductase
VCSSDLITPGTNHDSVAEQTFALLLALLRRIVVNDQTIRAGGWDRTTVSPARGKTLGLVGMGRIGRAVALRALAFGMRVIAFDTVSDAEFDARHGIERRALDRLLAEADVVSLHVPLTDATRGMINSGSLALMKPGALLLNTARGGLVVEADLCASLKSGHLAGAGLDVLNDEPPLPDNPLLRLPNVVLSPHMAGVDTLSMANMAEKAAECVVDLYQGRWPADCIVNGALAPAWRW